MKLLHISKSIKLSPTQVLALGLALIISLGTILLSLPIASADGRSIGFSDALFTATSASCVTGLLVKDTGTDFTLFGQLVILTLIQIGGLGFMTLATMTFVLLGKKITLRDRLVMQEALNQNSLQGIVSITKDIVFVTIAIEILGAILLAFRFIPQLGFVKGTYFSIFHSISAFCSAGFDIMGGYKSLTGYLEDPVVNLTICSLSILGGLGITVLNDIRLNRNPRKWSLHTKLVMGVTAFLLVFGTVFFLLVESGNPQTLGGYSLKGKILGSIFQSTTLRSVGFITVDNGALKDASKFLSAIFMFIGASPASTGGGIKTTTAAVIFLMTFNIVRGREDNDVFKRTIPSTITHRALAILLISLLTLISITMALSLIEGDIPFIDAFFKAASSLSTTGISVFDVRDLHFLSRTLLMAAMYAGKIGPLTLTLALARRQSGNKDLLKYPTEKIIVG